MMSNLPPNHPLPKPPADKTTAPAKPVSDDQVFAVTVARALPGKQDDAAIQRLAALPPMEYDRIRKDEAKRLNVQVKTLDDKVKAARSEVSTPSPTPFTNVEPWPEPVNLADLLSAVRATILRFVVLGTEEASACTLWVAHTYLFHLSGISPLLIANAPERACAKTLLQTVLAKVSSRPLSAANATVSALFRSIEKWQPTIFIDEADTFFRDNTELHGMVNAGYSRDGFLLRSEAVGDSFEPRLFSVYCPKSIAGIALEKHMSDATMSRGITINLRRKLSHETVERLRHADHQVFADLASKLARFAQDYAEQIRSARPPLPDELNDRAQDNWEPLLAIAQCAGPEWLQRATAAALMLSGTSETSASIGNELLSDIQEVFASKQVTKISTVDLIAALVSDEEAPWATYNRGKPISPRQLARQLANYGIASKTVRMGPHDTPKGYDLAQFTDTFARYLAPPSPELPQLRNVSPVALPPKVTGVSEATPGIRNAAPNPQPGNANPEDVAENPPQRNAEATPEPLPDLGSCGVAAETEGMGETESEDDEGPPPHIEF